MALEIDDAVEIMLNAHWGQKDKNGEPYVYHPWRVCGNLPLNLFVNQTAYCAALLHDVLEDTDWTEEDLRKEGADNYLIAILRVLTRKEGQGYSDYINGIAYGGSPITVEIKKADLRDNLRAGCPIGLESRYKKALHILGEYI